MKLFISEAFSLKLPTNIALALCLRAEANGVTPQEFIRLLLLREIVGEPDNQPKEINQCVAL